MPGIVRLQVSVVNLSSFEFEMLSYEFFLGCQIKVKKMHKTWDCNFRGGGMNS